MDHPRSLGPALRPLEALLRDPAVTEIHVNGPDGVWVRRGGRTRRADVEFSAGKIRVLADAIGRALEADEAATVWEARFEEGMRVAVVRPPAAPAGPLITLSRPPAAPATADDLVAEGGLSEEALARIRLAFDGGVGVLVASADPVARRALLAALACTLPEGERVALVDGGEVRPPPLAHLVRLRWGAAAAPCAAALSPADLLATARRLGPDRICLDDLPPAVLAELLLDAGDAYAGVVAAVPGSTAAAAVERLVTLARAACPGGDPAPLLPVCFGLVVVAGGGADAALRVREVAEITAAPGSGAPAVAPLFRRTGPKGALVSSARRPDDTTSVTAAPCDEAGPGPPAPSAAAPPAAALRAPAPSAPPSDERTNIIRMLPDDLFRSDD